MGESVIVGQIIKLDDGFILSIYGKDIAIRGPKELGRAVERYAKKPPQPSKRPLVPSEAKPHSLTATQSEVRAEISLDEAQAAELRNLDKLITARLNGLISGEDLMRGAIDYCPSMTPEQIAELVQNAEMRYFQMGGKPKRSSDEKFGAKCACASCQQNTSYPNPVGMCVSCYAGEHLHPQDSENPQRAVPVLEGKNGAYTRRSSVNGEYGHPPSQYGAGPTRPNSAAEHPPAGDSATVSSEWVQPELWRANDAEADDQADNEDQLAPGEPFSANYAQPLDDPEAPG